QVNPASAFEHHLIEAIEKIKQAVGNGKIQRERVAGHRKRHHAFLCAELFQHCQKRCATAAADSFERLDQSCAALSQWPYALILYKAALAIYPTPVVDRVER